jgi:hypothetical protein
MACFISHKDGGPVWGAWSVDETHVRSNLGVIAYMNVNEVAVWPFALFASFDFLRFTQDFAVPRRAVDHDNLAVYR